MSVVQPEAPQGEQALIPAGRLAIRMSFSGWSRLKDCPRSYLLRYVQKYPRSTDNFYTLPGKVPGRQAEEFFKLPPEVRNVRWFADTFDRFWLELTEGSTDPTNKNHVEWVTNGRNLLRKAGKLLPTTTDKQLFEAAFMATYMDCRSTSAAIAEMIGKLGLTKVTGRTELPFKTVIEPEENAEPWVPHLTLDGFMDIVIDRPNDDKVDVMDWKATKKPKKLDIDQLIIYRMALQSGGIPVARTGFLLIRQGEVDLRPVTDAMEMELRRQLRLVGMMYAQNLWKANVRKWKCPYCDVKQFCDAARQELGAAALGVT